MGLADFAGTELPICKMANTDNNSIFSVSALKYEIKKILFIVFQIPAQGVGAQIGNLDHARQLAINEKRRFNNLVYGGPTCSLIVKTLHRFGVLF